MNQEENTTFIGFGNMGSAIVKAIDKDKCFKQINVIEPDEISISRFLYCAVFDLRDRVWGARRHVYWDCDSMLYFLLFNYC